MKFDLTREQEQFIKQQLTTGRFADEGEVVTHALQLWQKYQQTMADVRAGVHRGIDDRGAGRAIRVTKTEEAFKTVRKQQRS